MWCYSSKDNQYAAIVGVVSVDQVVTACGRVGGEGDGITFTSSGPVEFDIPAGTSCVHSVILETVPGPARGR